MKYLILLFLALAPNALAQSGGGAGITQFIHNNAIQNVTDSLGLPVTFAGLASVTANQGTKGTIAQSWYVQPCDGTNCQTFLSTGEGKVSVTQPLPAGSNTIGSVNAIQSGTWNLGRTWTLGSGTDSVTIQGGNSTAVKTDGSATTQPISASSLPLPTGAATSAKQPALGTAGTPSTDVISIQGESAMTPLKVDGTATTQPVSAASLPLPSGASTSANQTTGNTSLSSIDGKLPAQVSGRVPVDGSGVTQPVSGTFWQATQPVSGTITATPPSISGFSSTGGSSSSQQSFAAPGSTKYLLVQGDPSNTDSIRFGSVATSATTGMILAPGQDSGLIPFSSGATVYAFPVTGTQKVNITWLF